MSNSNALDRLLDPVGSFLTPEVARRLAAHHADDETQVRLDEFAEKANEGTLTTAERDEYLTYVNAIDFIAILQAKARDVLARQSA